MEASGTMKYPALGFALAMAILGTVGGFVVQAGLDPVTTVFWRCVFGSAFLGLWCWRQGYLSRALLRPALLVRAGAIGVCVVLSWVAFFGSYPLTSIATTTIVYHIQPFFVVLLGVAFFRDRITRDQMLWMALAFIGMAVASGLLDLSSQGLNARWALGIALTLSAALLYAVATILAKGITQQPPAVTALCQTLIGIVMLAPFAHFAEPIPLASWAWLLGIGAIHTGIGYVLMYASLPRLKTPVIGGLTFIYPLVAILIDWLCYGHPLHVSQACGMILIAVATLAVRLNWRLTSWRRTPCLQAE